jgi:hypothetical protein
MHSYVKKNTPSAPLHSSLQKDPMRYNVNYRLIKSASAPVYVGATRAQTCAK